jgi:hypothetical protein
VYGAYTFGPAGKRVKVILLDVRYNRDDPTVPDRDILGEEQWQWFERELRESDAQINFVGSGIQVLPRDKPVQEKWANFPRSLARLEKTLQLSYVLRPLVFNVTMVCRYVAMLRCFCSHSFFEFFSLHHLQERHGRATQWRRALRRDLQDPAPVRG